MVCLASALTRLNGSKQNYTGDLEDAPLGPLTLAAILQSRGVDVSFFDLDCEFARREAGSFAVFADDIVASLASTPADVFGFSTLCGSYPITLRLTRMLKQLRPDCTIVLGGPHASVVDVATLQKFPHVDLIVRGEADESFPALLNALRSSPASLHFVPGLTWRNGSIVQRTPDAALVHDLDALPLPAFHLYRDVQETRVISLELGRGCPFACSFCSTNDFFRRRFRLKSPQTIIQQMRELNARYKARNFSLVHDMFTVDRRRVVAFCEAMIESGCGFQWSCSARTDCVDKDLLRLMAEAGCDGIFYGIESGSQKLQKEIRKSLVITEALAIVEETSKLGIPSTTSAITGFPTESIVDFRDTVSFLMEAARADDVETQLHLLAPLAGTPLAREHAAELKLDRTQSDISLSLLLTEEDWKAIEASPDIFGSFYHIPGRVDREYLASASAFVRNGLRRCRWLVIALHQVQGHILDVHDAWRSTADWATGSLETLAGFVAERYPHRAIQAIVHLYRALWRNSREQAQRSSAAPHIKRETAILELPFDLSKWLVCLRAKELDAFNDCTPSTIALTKAGRRETVLRLHPIQAGLLAWCDGCRTVTEIARLTDWTSFPEWPDTPREAVASIVLEKLVQEGIVEWDPQATDQISEQIVAASPSHSGGRGICA